MLPGHVANKIGMGATRNLVVQGYDNRHTEDVVRDDLDHIHNLVVVKMEFIGGNCYIGLNSVHNAIYARQCMLSRLQVKSGWLFGATLTEGTGDTRAKRSTTMSTNAPSPTLCRRPSCGRRRLPRRRSRRCTIASIF